MSHLFRWVKQFGEMQNFTDDLKLHLTQYCLFNTRHLGFHSNFTKKTSDFSLTLQGNPNNFR